MSRYENAIESYSQDAIVSFIDLLLVYSQRFTTVTQSFIQKENSGFTA